MKIVNYCIQCMTVYDGKDVADFQQSVQEMVDKGWQPYGDLVITARNLNNSVQFCQAMVIYSKNN